MMWKTKDLTPLAYLIPAWFGEMSVVTGFYFNKAKAENIIKLKKYYHVDINDIKDI
jgi:putative thiosulfate sulfurtransferase